MWEEWTRTIRTAWKLHRNKKALYYKRILTIMAAIVCLAACEKPVDTSKIIGTWSECYDDPNFVMDGSDYKHFRRK